MSIFCNFVLNSVIFPLFLNIIVVVVALVVAVISISIFFICITVVVVAARLSNPVSTVTSGFGDANTVRFTSWMQSTYQKAKSCVKSARSSHVTQSPGEGRELRHREQQMIKYGRMNHRPSDHNYLRVCRSFCTLPLNPFGLVTTLTERHRSPLFCCDMARCVSTSLLSDVPQACVAAQKLLRGKQGRLKARRELLRRCAAVEVRAAL